MITDLTFGRWEHEWTVVNCVHMCVRMWCCLMDGVFFFSTNWFECCRGILMFFCYRAQNSHWWNVPVTTKTHIGNTKRMTKKKCMSIVELNS